MARPLFRSTNPTLSPARFRDVAGEGTMTVAGTAWRSLVLLLLVVGSSAYTWWQLAPQPADAPGYVLWGAVGGLALALLTVFRPQLAPWTAPIYAVVEGMALGSLSMLLDARYAGLPRMAVVLTLGVFASMLALYAFRVVRVTQRMRTVVTSAILGILAFYLVSMLLGVFGIRIPAVHEGGPIGLAVSLFIVGVASFSLLLDFDMIEQASAAGAPKSMEWYGAFGLLVTLVWLYVEMLNLLRKVRE